MWGHGKPKDSILRHEQCQKSINNFKVIFIPKKNYKWTIIIVFVINDIKGESITKNLIV